MSDTAIHAEKLSKYYNLGTINNGTLWKDLQSWAARKRGREDPHSKIGENTYADSSEGFWALKNLNFEIQQGDRVGIIGKNGAGKSTLLKILSRITAPTEGCIKIKGRVASLLEVGTGFHSELTGRENIYLNGAILGMKRKEITRKLDEIIAFSEIEHHIDTPVKRYSSGMYVRLAFAVAAHLDSEILIADEVLAVGDVLFQKKALGKMNDLSTGQGRTILFVSHQMGAVTALCNSGIVLNKGRITMSGDLQKCINEYMKSKVNTETHGIWVGNQGDENLIITKVSTVNINSKTDYTAEYLRGDTIVLHIEYEIFKYNPNYVLNIEITNVNGTVLCESSATEFFAQNLDDINGTGKHTIELEIQTDIFAQGEYYINFDFAIRNQKRIIQDIPSLPFTIEDCETATSSFIPKRTNIISPSWNWNIN